MFTLPEPILANVNGFTITSPDLDASFACYQLLGFTEIFRTDFPFPLIMMTDGSLQIMLRKDPTPYIALTYYVKNIGKTVNELEAKGVDLATKYKPTDMVKRCLIKSPDGINISLVEIVDGFTQPPGPTMLQMPQEDYFTPEKYVNKRCGMFGEFAHPVADIDASMIFWEKLGFKVLSKMASPYPWAIISDGISTVGLHQTTSFTEPAITYFASDMREMIEQLKAMGLTNFTEKGPANIVVETPEKQHINLFKLGM